VLIEVSRDQRNKLEYDKDTDRLMLDRVLHSSCHYPGDYGFVPRTLCPDGIFSLLYTLTRARARAHTHTHTLTHR
jgi:hypothetical protein